MARRAEPLEPPKPAPRPERVKAFQLGLSAESRAAMLLVAKAYRIVARRWKTPFGEIDIVARRRRALVFVEVKARDKIDDAARSGDRADQAPHHQRRRILAGAASRRRQRRDPLRRDGGGAGQDAAATSPMRSTPRRLSRGRSGPVKNCVEHCRPSPLCPPLPLPLQHGFTDDFERRRPDGPDRADQYPRRFHLRLAAGSAGARPRAVLLHARPAGAARRQSVGQRCSRSACATRPATISRSANRATSH